MPSREDLAGGLGAGPQRCPYCGRAREIGRPCAACGFEPPFVPCGSCRRLVAEHMEQCVCGVPRVVWNEAGGAGPCVRCRTDLSRAPVEETSAHLDVCGKCLGCFVRTRDLAELFDRAEAGTEVRLPGALEPAPGQAPSQPDRLQLVTCPHCRREMDRTRFAQRASLVVDVCPVHGMWLDAGELQGLLAFVKDRAAGVAAPGAVEREDEEKWRRIVVDRLNEESRVSAAVEAARASIRNRWSPPDD